ncbi:MAG: hypothetical protein DRQ55_04265 [Planctomycetota bacterium]|nr:MAG: hypothetical protein DRQ55_04265 [Planctomycetota bacterium]
MRPTALVAVFSLCFLASLTPTSLHAQAHPQRPPFLFVENLGQEAAPARFVARGESLSVFFTPGGARLVLEPEGGAAAAVFLALEGARRAEPEALGQPLTRIHSYRGRDPSRWVSDARAFAGLAYRNLHEGVDLHFVTREGRLSYDLVLAPGADAGGLVMRCEGALGLALTDDGGLAVRTAAGTLQQSAPLVWERAADGSRDPVPARFVLLDQQRWRFDVQRRDPQRALVIDPGLTWGSHLGGGLADRAQAVALTPEGHVIVAGSTGSHDFPTTPGAIQGAITGYNDAFVVRIDPSDGAFMFATFLGGADAVIFRPDVAQAVTVGDDGFVLVAGTSASPDFPTTSGALQQLSSGGTDAFVARLHPDGSLNWSTLLGGSGHDEATALALDADGTLTVAGMTFSNDFPTSAGAFDESFNSLALTNDGWVARLSSDGAALAWSTYLGGSLRDELCALALDALGRPVVAGLTGSSDLPTTPGAFDTSFNGGGSTETDALVARLSADGSDLEWCTYLGSVERVEAQALALSALGEVLVAGETHGSDFPVTPDAPQPVYGGGACDGFVTRLASDGGSLVWSSFLGGAADDRLEALALSSGEQATVAGSSGSLGLIAGLLPKLSPAASGLLSDSGVVVSQGGSPGPLVPGGPGPGARSAAAFDLSLGGTQDGLIARFSSDGARLLYASFYGGSGREQALGLALDEVGAAWIVGLSDSADLPLAGASVQPGPQGAQDAFVARMSVPPLSWFAADSAGDGARPRLSARGAFEPGSPWSLRVSGLRPGARVWLLAGPPGPGAPLLACAASRAGAVLAPWPVNLALCLPADARGEARWAGPSWPLSSGEALVLQAWGPGPCNSAALQLVTP